MNVCHNPGFAVDKAAHFCAHHYNHWIEEGVCDKVPQNQSGSIVLGCGCDHGRDLDCSVEILNCCRRIDEVARVGENGNETTNNNVGFVGGRNDGGDRVMGSGLYLSS